MALSMQDVAPPFELPSTSGETLSLASLRGRKVVLYFYPRDNTPGCTTESVDFRDRYEAFQEAGVEVVGVSKDSLDSHHRFREKFTLPFPLLTDADNAVAEAYGAYGLKNMYGKKVKGTIRSTFLIDEEGVIQGIWSPVRVPGHAEEVLLAAQGKAPAPKAKPAKEAAPKAATKAAKGPAGTKGGKAQPGPAQGRSFAASQAPRGGTARTRGAARGR